MGTIEHATFEAALRGEKEEMMIRRFTEHLDEILGMVIVLASFILLASFMTTRI